MGIISAQAQTMWPKTRCRNQHLWC